MACNLLAHKKVFYQRILYILPLEHPILKILLILV
nr:MAG TPA: hypothetical protein [Bacteriophage sp.]